MEQEVKLCDEVETVRECIYFGDSVSASVGCKAAVTASTRCFWPMFMKYSEVLCGKQIFHRLHEAVCKSYISHSVKGR